MHCVNVITAFFLIQLDISLPAGLACCLQLNQGGLAPGHSSVTASLAMSGFQTGLNSGHVCVCAQGVLISCLTMWYGKK